MTRLDYSPSLHLIPSNIDQLSDTEKCTILQSLTKVLLELVHIHQFEGRYPSSYDGVNIYASEVLSLRLLYMEFRDRIKRRWVTCFVLLEVPNPFIQSNQT